MFERCKDDMAYKNISSPLLAQMKTLSSSLGTGLNHLDNDVPARKPRSVSIGATWPYIHIYISLVKKTLKLKLETLWLLLKFIMKRPYVFNLRLSINVFPWQPFSEWQLVTPISLDCLVIYSSTQ